jgi:hypothetical protein
MRTEPLYGHDCSKCIFLGSGVFKEEGDCDLYFCDSEYILIARASSELNDYITGDAHRVYNVRASIRVARLLAMKKGLLR